MSSLMVFVSLNKSPDKMKNIIMKVTYDPGKDRTPPVCKETIYNIPSPLARSIHSMRF